MKFAAIFFTLVLVCCIPLHAETVRDAHTEVELVPEVSFARAGGTLHAGVLFRMEPHWHVYWLNPGDSGMTPEIGWHLPEGWKAGPILWPYPERIPVDPLVSYGYEGEVLLMSELKIPAMQAGGTVYLKASVRWLACQIECVPGKAELSVPVEIGESGRADAGRARLFSETRAKFPLAGSNRKIEAFLSGEKIVVKIPSEENLVDLYFFPESGALLQHAEPQPSRKIPGGVELEVSLSANYPKSLDRLRGLLFTKSGWRGVDSEKSLWIDVPLKDAVHTPPAAGMGLWSALLFAFIGGLILNLMPCVLPVLSLKVLNFVKEAAENPADVFRHGLVFTGGVLLSFWFLAGLLILFQAAGKYAGWGFQLQSPSFLLVLTFIFFLFALNLFGVFEIGTSLTAAGQPGSRKGFSGSFFSGIFATVVATPCTAPFMGAALGFSLSQPAWISFLIFTSLGLGMAAPYLLLCSQPVLLRFVPKPGAWMVRLKQILGLPLLATCAWLLWVLSLQKGTAVLKPVLAGMAFAALAGWIYGKWAYPGTAEKTRRKALGAALIFLTMGIGLSFWSVMQERTGSAHSASKSENGIAWQPYSADKLEALLNEKRPVFVDFTAAWCLTCQVNERVALEVPPVVEAFKQSGVVPLKADWTSQDPEITRALSGYGRNSIPFYVLYPAGSREPVFLPELLTPGIVLEYLKRNSNNPRKD